MRRFDPEHPMRMAYVVGTFAAHPAVMGAMCEFLSWVVQPKPPPRRGRQPALHRLDQRDQSTPRRRPRCRCAWSTSARCGRSCSRNRAATTGCCSTYLRAEGITLSWVACRPLPEQHGLQRLMTILPCRKRATRNAARRVKSDALVV